MGKRSFPENRHLGSGGSLSPQQASNARFPLFLLPLHRQCQWSSFLPLGTTPFGLGTKGRTFGNHLAHNTGAYKGWQSFQPPTRSPRQNTNWPMKNAVSHKNAKSESVHSLLLAPAESSQAGLLPLQDRLIAGSDADAAAEDGVPEGSRTTEGASGDGGAAGSDPGASSGGHTAAETCSLSETGCCRSLLLLSELPSNTETGSCRSLLLSIASPSNTSEAPGGGASAIGMLTNSAGGSGASGAAGTGASHGDG